MIEPGNKCAQYVIRILALKPVNDTVKVRVVLPLRLSHSRGRKGLKSDRTMAIKNPPGSGAFLLLKTHLLVSPNVHLNSWKGKSLDGLGPLSLIPVLMLLDILPIYINVCRLSSRKFPPFVLACTLPHCACLHGHGLLALTTFLLFCASFQSHHSDTSQFSNM